MPYRVHLDHFHGLDVVVVVIGVDVVCDSFLHDFDAFRVAGLAGDGSVNGGVSCVDGG